jgi:iron(III) transport system ATP-binding protein
VFLEIEDLTFAYPGADSPLIYDGFNLSLSAGERLGVGGPSGGGKSTLLRLIAGLEIPLGGRVTIDGRLVAGPGTMVSPEDRQVGMVFQDYGLFPHMSVAKNIAYGLYRLPKGERRRRVESMLDLIRMRELAERLPYEISGGQQQRVAVARALAPAPKLLLLDEPLSNLDAELRSGIRADMLELIRGGGTACVLVSHDVADLRAVCDRIIKLGGGADDDGAGGADED